MATDVVVPRARTSHQPLTGRGDAGDGQLAAATRAVDKAGHGCRRRCIGDDVTNQHGATTIRDEFVAACGDIAASISVHEDRLLLRVRRGGHPLPVELRLGITVAGVDLGSGSRLVGIARREVAGSWTARSGKATGLRRYLHQEADLRLAHHGGLEWRIVVRVAGDGIAVRYAIPNLQGLSRLDADGTGITLPRDSRAWVLDYQTWYETPRRGVDLAELAEGDYGFPFLARLGTEPESIHLLVTESAIDGRFSGAHALLRAGGALGFALADASVEIARGEVTPWRVFVVGSLAGIVESRLVDELAPPASAALERAGWVRPGRAAWSWWSDFYSGAQLSHQKHFVDVAAALGWEHLLIDCGWDATWVPEIVAYASLRGIQVHLWTIWHDLDGPEKLAKLALWRSWGVAGIKVDFMESEAKDRYRWYDSVLAETARLGLMVNFHGSVIPRGWNRTWPQVVGYEAIRGSEYYVFYDDTPLTAAHDVIQPFTRNVVGAMDYTPVAFSAPGRSTSDGHELGLSIAFECGITHFADSVDNYLARPLAARLLCELPASWDETLLLAGTPDTEAVIARRRADRWFVGAIATGPARTLRVPLQRLGLGAVRVWGVADAEPAAPSTDAARGLREIETRLLPGEPLEIAIAHDGGFAAIVVGDGHEQFRAAARATRPAPRISPALAELDAEGTAVLSTTVDASLRVPPGWRTEPLGEGRWRVIADAALRPGELGVVTVEAFHDDDPVVPAVTHARLVRPLSPGNHGLSALPFLSFTNESGPVERDQSNGGGNPGDGTTLSIAGARHDDGIGVSTPSALEVFLGARASRLTASIGIDDETPGTRAVARVLGDGVELASFALASGSNATEADVDVRGVRVLTLATEAHPGDTVPAHVDWARARILVPDDDLHAPSSDQR